MSDAIYPGATGPLHDPRVLVGHEVTHLLEAIVPLGQLGERLLDEAKSRYEARFDVGRNSTGHHDPQ